MSRFGDWDYYDEDFPNQGELWAANARRALKGKRGKKALAELREALLALPQKRLIQGALCTVGAEQEAETTANRWAREELLDLVRTEGEGVCAMGAYLWWKKVKAGASPEEAFAALPRGSEDAVETADLGKSAGLTWTLAYDIAWRNDQEYGRGTPEHRYERFMAWIDGQLGAEAREPLSGAEPRGEA